MKKRYAITEAISAIFIFLFVYTALSKIFTFNLFTQTLKETPLIGGIAIYIAFLLPAVELTVSLLLLIPRTRRFGLYSTFALMLVFTLYLGYMILFTPQRPCTCGGVLEKMTWTQHLILNIFLNILSFTAILMNPRK